MPLPEPTFSSYVKWYQEGLGLQPQEAIQAYIDDVVHTTQKNLSPEEKEQLLTLWEGGISTDLPSDLLD